MGIRKWSTLADISLSSSVPSRKIVRSSIFTFRFSTIADRGDDVKRAKHFLVMSVRITLRGEHFLEIRADARKRDGVVAVVSTIAIDFQLRIREAVAKNAAIEENRQEV